MIVPFRPTTAADFAFFSVQPWDMSSSSYGVAAGIVNDPAASVVLGENAWKSNVPSGFRLYTRVRTWRLSGNLKYYLSADALPYMEGALDVPLSAVDYADAVFTNEERITQHGGWLGAQEEVTGWTLTYENEEEDIVTDPIDVGGCTMRLWNKVRLDANGDLYFPSPEILFAPNGGGSVSFGRRIPADACEVNCVMPVTYDGGFDGTDMFGFQLQLGSPGDDPFGHIEGVLTLQPDETIGWWQYDPEDGDGPFYDQATGKWLRTPMGFDSDLVVP